MARAQGIKLENNFSFGLVTETTELRYPPNSCVDILNCVVEQEGLVKRRPPLDIETSTADAADLGLSLDTDQISKPVVEYVWTSVGGDGDKSFLVVQYGRYLRFFDVSESSSDTMTNIKAFSVDLEAYLPSGSTLTAGEYPCSFANGRGQLVVVNKAIDPIRIEYDPNTDGVTVTSFAIKFRDFEGVPSTISSETRPTGSVAAISTSNPAHIYNLYNAGWSATDALSQWDTARSDLPSLCDTISTFRASDTDAFDNAKVGPKSNGNTLAPRGKFILSLGLEERTALSGVDVGGNTTSIGFVDPLASNDTTQSGFSGNSATPTITFAVANANDTDTSSFANLQVALTPSGGNINSGTTRWQISKTFTSPTKVFSVVVKGPASASLAGAFLAAGQTATTSRRIFVYGVTGALSATLGTLIGSGTYTNATGETIIILSTDSATEWDHIQIVIDFTTSTYAAAAATTHNVRPASIDIYTTVDTATSYSRPEQVAFFAGRIWYGASGYDEKGTNVYFSQVLERNEQFGLCHQVNDPTSEYFFDLLASDGGSVSIPEIANVVGLFPMRSAMVVLATNGIWVIRGSSSEGFSATSYRVEKVTSTGCVSRYSVCDVKGLPVWMGEDGIYTLEYDPNFNAFQLKSLSDERVRTFIKDIPASRKVYSKIQYDTTEQILRVLYHSTSGILGDEYYYNYILNYDINSKAWYPWLFSLNVAIQGMVNVADANHVYPALLKFLVLSDDIGSANKMYFADLKHTSTNHVDFDSFVDDYAPSATGSKYTFTSHFVTAPMMDAQLLKFFQSNYIMVFMNTVAGSGCALQGQFDWTSSGDSGKWSTSQEIYRTIDDSRLAYRRLKVRGKGRALSFKFRSTGTGPFEIIGWAVQETANQGV
jgi:hypothetical protein